jgi:transposase
MGSFTTHFNLLRWRSTVQTTPQNSTTRPLLLAFELGGSYWKLAFQAEPAGRIRLRNVAVCNSAELLELVLLEIAAAKARLRLPEDAPVVSCYEAGRDGFWLHRALRSKGLQNVIIEPASLKVDRRRRRAKTDRLDAQDMLTNLHRHWAGEKVWRVVNAPGAEAEDLRRLPRQRERLVKQRTRLINTVKGLLNLEGIKKLGVQVVSKGFEKALKGARRFDGSPLPPRLLDDLYSEIQRLRLVQAQIKKIEDEQKALLKQEQPAACAIVEKAQRLTALNGVGTISAFVLSAEFYGWREFKNRRQVGSLAGLTDSPWKSDGIDRQQGISKAGNRRVRALAVELSWSWLRYQPQSQLAQWFHGYVGNGKKKRMKRVAIVALARKLLVAFWRYLEHGLVPEGATLKLLEARATQTA